MSQLSFSILDYPKQNFKLYGTRSYCLTSIFNLVCCIASKTEKVLNDKTTHIYQ